MRLSEIRGAYYGGRPRESRLATSVLTVASRVGVGSDGTFHVSGYASTTGAPYEVNDWLGSYDETIARGAFTKTLQERDDTRFLINHDGIPLARSASGTLVMREITNPADDPQGKNQTGLWIDSDLDSASPLAQTLRSALERGDVSQMSFAFQAVRQEWNEDYTQRTVNEVKLFDVSAVSYPANPLTSISANSVDIASLMSRVDSGKGLDVSDREMIADLVARVAAIEAASQEDGAESDSDEAEDLVTAAREEARAIRQNRLDALKRQIRLDALKRQIN